MGCCKCLDTFTWHRLRSQKRQSMLLSLSTTVTSRRLPGMGFRWDRPLQGLNLADRGNLSPPFCPAEAKPGYYSGVKNRAKQVTMNTKKKNPWKRPIRRVTRGRGLWTCQGTGSWCCHNPGWSWAYSFQMEDILDRCYCFSFHTSFVLKGPWLWIGFRGACGLLGKQNLK